MLILGEQYLRPVPPVDLADEAQKWARETGRRFGRMEWEPVHGCFAIHFGRRPTDPVMRAWQEGTLEQANEPTESILLQEWDARKKAFAPMDLEQMGPSGLRTLLDQASLISGRGEANSLQESIIRVQERNQKVREGLRAKVREAGAEIDWLTWRRRTGTPYLTVGIDLKGERR